ncbi:hypothetical protein T069G_09996 [Trichoderma breve]|uniref:Uncharacterized protein n=1 Tax=Trichoderma breve TaxID=2034170 RepID=A0A9W9B589_9HYPO|nr:hypothetical protein T069G_09996 [Trichoderma breve]KAJ4856628.1 hypothetical protein T069G_09996 [Trichoderma breve]
MDSTSSNLTNLGCDFVVATTQASINSSMVKFIDQARQEVKYLCYLVNPTTGDLEDPITLEELMKQTGGINPFDIPKGTPYDDPRITACTNALFQVGIKMRIGIPRNVNPRDLSIVNFGQKLRSVDFNMYYSDITVIENDPVKWGYSGSWNIWEQPSDKPWAASCTVDLVLNDLSKHLDDLYFNSHPDAKFQLRRALENLSDTMFSLEQLCLRWGATKPRNDVNFPGMDMKTKAGGCLVSCLFKGYLQFASRHSFPPLVVSAVTYPNHDPSLYMTAISGRAVNPPRDSSGNPLSSPSSSEQAIATLNYICTINNNGVTDVSDFNWNWVRLEDVNNKSGVIAIRRNVVAQFFLDVLKRLAPRYMYEPVARKEENYRLQLLKGEWLSDATANLTNDDSSRVLHIQAGVPPSEPLPSWDDQSNGMKVYIGQGIKYAKVDIHPGYSCDVYFEGQEVRIEQRLWVTAAVAAEFPHQNRDYAEHKPFDKYLTEKYSLSVRQGGGFYLSRTSCMSDDKSERCWEYGDSDSSDTETAKKGFFYNLRQMMDDLMPAEMSLIDICQPNRFIFPGAQPFTYQDPFFSKHQDLIASIPRLNNYMVSPNPDPQTTPSVFLIDFSTHSQN